MIAIRIHKFGSTDVISVEQIEVPRPGQGEVLIRVQAAGVGPWDAWVRAGRSVLPQPLPLTLGSDVCGIIESVADGASGFVNGDAVFGVTNPRFTGGYAEYAVAASRMIAPKPKTLSAVEAASVPVVAVTAWQMLFHHAKAAAGQTVFVHGGAGNVGGYAVQLARRRGLRVIASAFDHDVEFVRNLGANEVVSIASPRIAEFARSADAVIDTVGGESQRLLFTLVKPGGIIVSSVSPPSPESAEQQGIRTIFFVVDVNTADLERLTEMFDAGELSASVGTILPLTEARQAHEMLEGKRSHKPGKIVLQVGPGRNTG
jgi:NADPH:quinone reductase-like Zn-dependent oxidoreductase